MTEVFARYGNGEGRPDHLGPTACTVNHPDAGGQCPREAIGEVWALSFCEVHGREAELAAKSEIAQVVERELQVLADAEFERGTDKSPVLPVLRAASSTYEVDPLIHDAATLRAYPPDELADNIDPEISSFDYGEEYFDGPVEWWDAAADLLVRFMRLAQDRGVLTAELEYLRERATVQKVLAERDWERRYAEPRRAAKEARRRGERATSGAEPA